MLDGLFEMGAILIHFATIGFDRGHLEISMVFKVMRVCPALRLGDFAPV
jgi:hypothetical protein